MAKKDDAVVIAGTEVEVVAVEAKGVGVYTAEF